MLVLYGNYSGLLSLLSPCFAAAVRLSAWFYVILTEVGPWPDRLRRQAIRPRSLLVCRSCPCDAAPTSLPSSRRRAETWR